MITVNTEPMEWRPGMTVKDVLKEKEYTFPLVGVWIDDEPVPRDDFPHTEVPDGAKVQVIHSISGG